MALKKSQLYAFLWQSCDELRGGMDASQYKDYVLFMLFIKYISDKYADYDGVDSRTVTAATTAHDPTCGSGSLLLKVVAVVHEMIHLLEPVHSDRFITLLSQHCPAWQEARLELNELPVAGLSV